MRKTSRIYEEERLLLRVQEALADAIERSQMTRAEVAARLGKNRSFVTQALSSGRNLTLASLSALAWATGHRIEPQLARLSGHGESATTHTLKLVRLGRYELASPNDADAEPATTIQCEAA
jgi:hypothetical protein